MRVAVEVTPGLPKPGESWLRIEPTLAERAPDAATSARLIVREGTANVPEVRLGDIPSTGKRYVTPPPAQQIIGDQTAKLPPTVGEAVRSLVDENEQRLTPEAICARDADKLECLLQAREYQAAGNTDVQPWVETSVAALRSPSGRRLGALCQQLAPKDWWAAAARAANV